MVAHRTQEMGLRMAIGAPIPDVLLLVARWGLAMVADRPRRVKDSLTNVAAKPLIRMPEGGPAPALTPRARQ
jgi:hypothetical protein